MTSSMLRPPQIRRASTSSSSSSYPFPTHSHPTPHQIFHLPVGATKSDVKARYYDLVRIYHPDSPHCRHIDARTRHARFQSIRAAYDTLMGKGFNSGAGGGTIDPVYAELERRRRAQNARRRAAEFADGAFGREGAGAGKGRDWEASADDRWKDRIILTVGVISLLIGIGPALWWRSTSIADQAHAAAAANLAQARREAREFGAERREEIRRRVKAHKEELERQQMQSPSDNSSPDETISAES
ncbi:hypothetical protein K474DRAFT_1692044 [Panus rudis PR-1116 ss-1]|nr:hypothetical protein K474DRAFT_1692044 [Panus rudis PR-1116 ss-1]